MRVVPMTNEHADAVLAIYQAGIDDGDATFEAQAPTWEQFDRTHLREHRAVAVEDGQVLGWVAAVPALERLEPSGGLEAGDLGVAVL